LLSYLRLGTSILLAFAPIFYLNRFFFSGSSIAQVLKISAAVIAVIVFFSLGLPLLSDYLELKGVTGFARQNFVETFIKSSDSGSVIYAIYTMPTYLQVPLGFLFFLFTPFLTFQFYTEGVVNIRNILFTTIMPIISLVYFKHFFSGILYSIKKYDPSITKFIFVFFFMILIISQLSIQPRHKTSIMPLFYILVAYGVTFNDKISRQLSLSFVILFGLVQLISLM
jgi:hypothetical protein